MAKDKISDYSSTANSNTDIAGINIDEGCAPSGINDAIRTLMAQLKTWQSGGQDVYIHPAGSASAPSITANGDTNTGIFFPAADTVGITTGGTERARVDSSGNLGLGVTPSAWTTFTSVLQTKQSSLFSYNGNTYLYSNYYYDGGPKYMTNNEAMGYAQENGGHYWNIAASGTAGNSITFTQAMTLDASGNLGVGTTSPASKLDVVTTSAGGLNSRIYNSATSGNTYAQLQLQTDAGNFYIFKQNSTNSTNAGAGSMGLYGDGAYPMAFYTNSTERARIDSSGNLLVGTTSATVSEKMAVYFLDGRRGIRVECSGTAANDAINFRNPNGGVGAIQTSGTSTSYLTSSDYRLKENVQPITSALEKVALLNPCTYTWKADGSVGQGFIAHELQAIVPDCVSGEKDAVDDEGNPKYQGIDTSFLVATLTAAIQELNAKVDAQAAEIAALKG